jgi:hypothetical protein
MVIPGGHSLLMNSAQLSIWMASRPCLWQMTLLDADDLSRLTGSFGYGLPFSADDIEGIS